MSKITDPLDKLVSTVLKSPKYKHVCEELVRHIGAQELAIRHGVKEATKTTKRKLHQIGGAYFETAIDYERGLDNLREAMEARDERRLRRTCKELMGLHASTRERLEILEAFYTTTMDDIRPIRTVLDVACGLNPLAIPWMPLDRDVKYYAYDIYTDLMGFVQKFMRLVGVAGCAEARDVTLFPPTHRADVAFILKTIPCLEQLDKSAGLRLLEAVNADYLLVSFPVHSLGGRNKGMVENYEAKFRELVQGKNWSIRRFEFASELAFLVTKEGR